jgi:hypothetical protein
MHLRERCQSAYEAMLSKAWDAQQVSEGHCRGGCRPEIRMRQIVRRAKRREAHDPVALAERLEMAMTEVSQLGVCRQMIEQSGIRTTLAPPAPVPSRPRFDSSKSLTPS